MTSEQRFQLRLARLFALIGGALLLGFSIAHGWQNKWSASIPEAFVASMGLWEGWKCFTR